MITLQYVHEVADGFECRLFDLANDITLIRPRLAELKEVATFLINEITQPGRTLAEHEEQFARFEQLFSNPTLPRCADCGSTTCYRIHSLDRGLPKSDVPAQTESSIRGRSQIDQPVS